MTKTKSRFCHCTVPSL